MSLKSSPLPDDESREILMKYFTSALRSGYELVQGCTMPLHSPEVVQGIRDLNVTEDDVFVCSFPKAGTTWTQEMVWCIKNNLDLEKAKSKSLNRRSPYLELNIWFDYSAILSSGPADQFPEFMDSLKFLNSLHGPRIIKTHLPPHLLPKQMQDEQRPGKIIYVSRDARDCLISYYHHSKLLDGYTGDFQNFMKLFISGRVPFGPYWDNVLGYWNIRNQRNVLFITYEDMKKDLPSVIRTVSKFLNISYSDEQINMLSDHLSFESMKSNRSVNFEKVKEFHSKYGVLQGEGMFMRSGETGQFLKTMNKSEIELMNEWCQKNIENTDYQLPKYND